MRRLSFVLPILVAAAIGGVLAVLLMSDRNPAAIPSPLIGRQAPAIDLPALADLDEVEGITAADLTGEVTVVNFFASWCLPCLAEHPLITEIAAEGYRVYGINYRDEAPYGADWLRRNGNPYARVGADFEARAGLEFGVTGVPETFIIDRHGVIRHKHAGPMTERIVREEILPILRDLSE